MSNHPKRLNQYFRSIGKALPYPISMKRHILSQFREDVEDYLTENPQSTMEAIHRQFGTPQEVAIYFMDGQDAPYLMENIRVKRKFLFLMACVMAAVFLFGAWYAMYQNHVSLHHTGYHVIERIH